MPPSIVEKIKNKNNYAKIVRSARLNYSSGQIKIMEHRLNEMRQEIKNSISDHKLTKKKRLRSKILLADPTRRKFWRFIKHLGETSSNITALYDENENMVFNIDEIEDVILKHFNLRFAGQLEPPITDKSYLQDHTNVARNEMIELITDDRDAYDPNTFELEVCKPYTFTELEEALNHLPGGKSAGYDCIPNELLKNCGPKYRLYLHTFLNRIMETGCVPEELNAGKCILIYKVKSIGYITLIVLLQYKMTSIMLYFPYTIQSKRKNSNRNGRDVK